MKNICVLLCLLMAACAPGEDGIDGEDGTSCSVTQNADGSATVYCTDGTVATLLPGEDGANGTDGENGADGTNGSDGQDGTNGSDGQDGANGQDGVDGSDGQDGANGADGQDGVDGTSCTVEQTGEGAVISCTDGTSATVANGTDGQDGEDGQDAYADHLAFVLELNSAVRSVVNIQMYNADDIYVGRCTGTKASETSIVTADHCSGEDVVTFRFFYGTDYVGSAPKTSVAFYNLANRDSIIINGVVWSPFGAQLPSIQPHFGYNVVVGETVGLLSHPINLVVDLQTTIGYVSDENFVGLGSYATYWSESFLADLVSAGGSSGAPVFSRDGKWIGLLVGGFTPDSGLDLSIVLPFR